MLFTGSATTRSKDNLKMQLPKIFLTKKSHLTGVKNAKNRFSKVTQKKTSNISKTAPTILLIFFQNQVRRLYYRYQLKLEKVIIAFSSNRFLKRG